MGTNCAFLIADLFLFAMNGNLWPLFLIIMKLKLFKHLTQHLDIDDNLNIYHPYFEGMVARIYPPELQLNEANASDIEPPFWICIYLY